MWWWLISIIRPYDRYQSNVCSVGSSVHSSKRMRACGFDMPQLIQKIRLRVDWKAADVDRVRIHNTISFIAHTIDEAATLIDRVLDDRRFCTWYRSRAKIFWPYVWVESMATTMARLRCRVPMEVPTCTIQRLPY